MSEKRSRLGPGAKPPIDPVALDKFAADALTVPTPGEEPPPPTQLKQQAQPKAKKPVMPAKDTTKKLVPPKGKPKKEKVKGTASTKKTHPPDVYPWDEPHVRADVKKQVLLRLPEPLHLKLAWLANKSPSAFNSMNEIILEGTERLVEAELKKIIG